MPLHSSASPLATTNRYAALRHIDDYGRPKKQKRLPEAPELASLRDDFRMLSTGGVPTESGGLLDLFQDPVSFELYRHPYVTPCGHTFSANTLLHQSAGIRADEMRCAMCRSPFSLLGAHPNLALRSTMSSFGLHEDTDSDTEQAMSRKKNKLKKTLTREQREREQLQRMKLARQPAQQPEMGSVAGLFLAFGGMFFLAWFIPCLKKGC